jgi:predicted nucleotide-binding protein
MPAILNADQCRQGIARLGRRLEELKQFDPTSVKEQFKSPELTALAAAIDEALMATFGHFTTDYERYRSAADFSWGPVNMYDRTPIARVHRALQDSKQENIALLERAIRSLEERLAELSTSSPGTAEVEAQPREKTKKIFVVHGHDEGPKQAVARLLEQLGLEPIILHEQPSRGRTIIEKVEAHGDVGFAVVLLTPDDEGKAKGEGELRPRARQNVVIELGYFIGRLKRENVCALVKGDVEAPSDFDGVVYVKYEDGSTAWRQGLGQELQAAGYAIDWNKIMR